MPTSKQDPVGTWVGEYDRSERRLYFGQAVPTPRCDLTEVRVEEAGPALILLRVARIGRAAEETTLRW